MSIRTEQEGKPVNLEEPKIASFRLVLKNRNFLLIWMAQLISLTILNAANYGLVVLVNDITHSVIMVGLAIIAFTLPAIPFGAVAGVIVDRRNKRNVMWITNLLRMGTMLLMFVSLLYNQTLLWPLYVLTFLTSSVGQFFVPAEGAAIPLLVGKRDLMPALSLFQITMTLSQAVGFLLLGRIVATLFPPFTVALGALVLHVQSIDMLFLIVAVLYALCAVLILYVPAQALDQVHLHKETIARNTYRDAGKAFEALWNEMVSGWRLVRTDRLLYFAVVQCSVVGVIMQLIGELAGAFVQQVLHHPAEDMSLILAPAAIGMVGASAFMPRITERVDKIRLTVIGFVALAAGFLLLPASQWMALHLDPRHGAESVLLLWTVMGLVFLLGVAMACVNIPTQTMMQERAPETGRARVLSLQYMLYNIGCIPVLLFAGVVAQFIGFNQLVVLISLSILCFCWWGKRYIRGSHRPQL